MNKHVSKVKCKQPLVTIGILFCTFSISACTTVQPWEKNHLAKQEMTWYPDPLQARLKDHIYHSKEGSAGSTGSAGGGCGCN